MVMVVVNLLTWHPLAGCHHNKATTTFRDVLRGPFRRPAKAWLPLGRNWRTAEVLLAANWGPPFGVLVLRLPFFFPPFCRSHDATTKEENTDMYVQHVYSSSTQLMLFFFVCLFCSVVAAYCFGTVSLLCFLACFSSFRKWRCNESHNNTEAFGF